MPDHNVYDVLIQRGIGEVGMEVLKLVKDYNTGVIEIKTCLGTFVYDGTGRNRILNFNGETILYDLEEIILPQDDTVEKAWKFKSRMNSTSVYDKLRNSINAGRPNVGPEVVEVDYEDVLSLLSLLKAVIPGTLPLAYTRVRNGIRTQMKDKTEEVIGRDMDPLEKIREVERIEALIRKCDNGSL